MNGRFYVFIVGFLVTLASAHRCGICTELGATVKYVLQDGQEDLSLALFKISRSVCSDKDDVKECENFVSENLHPMSVSLKNQKSVRDSCRSLNVCMHERGERGFGELNWQCWLCQASVVLAEKYADDVNRNETELMAEATAVCKMITSYSSAGFIVCEAYANMLVNAIVEQKLDPSQICSELDFGCSNTSTNGKNDWHPMKNLLKGREDQCEVCRLYAHAHRHHEKFDVEGDSPVINQVEELCRTFGVECASVHEISTKVEDALATGEKRVCSKVGYCHRR
eukprot:TRINITY_DN2252_c0_g1_i1.p1 TRINITY_DN2252_c0_g1~~TRINITY_DN2252_c0_g1_i1.p1  ORF type:complete len:282 (-),score=41.21 TRINITY_DN2252_c0_g1_i1:52-897(-)